MPDTVALGGLQGGRLHLLWEVQPQTAVYRLAVITQEGGHDFQIRR
jgi:hypothetical protein